ncbi:tetratricopeptide repeat protein [Dolichospermum sp. UHCC 0684]|uniref:tetratricopeptide repeat protein n=1 Tax=unclassified Dolichospermum TaxID=2622029 RepID=UPI0014457436|nr:MULTISPECIES: tetratricopeptide repeat protein [unclassified Dolichospermum]MEA5531031.1 tetratricopeptide repeat protein [Dolichospermum sp. UHCC 0684]MTJ36923.1 tetratricopeptide repeat protein [Dolichospermum sp. UHCC 0260]
MSVIFLAECGSKEQAEVFSQHFKGIYWTLEDNIDSECDAEIRQDFEDNWWSILSASAIDWTPANREEGNYRYFQISELQRHLQEHLKSAPAFRYGLIGEIEKQDLNNLLTDSDYGATYSHLVSSASSENTQTSFRVPIFVYALKAGFLLSQSLYQEVRSPSNFKPFIQGYVWLPPSSTIISGGIQAPPKDVITGQTMRVFIDPTQAKIYIQQGLELNKQGQFIKALDNLEKAQKLNPFSTEIHRFKAFTLFSLKRLDEALQHCDFAIQFASPQSESLLIAYQLKGDILYEQGKLEEALEAFNNSLELNPNDYYAFHPFYKKGLILAKLERDIDALNACNIALSLSPKAEAALQLKLGILESLIKIEDREFLGYYHHEQGMLLGSLERHQEAAVAFDNCLKVQVNSNQRENSVTYYNKGHALWNSGNWEEGLACYDMAILLNPDYAMAHYDKGNLLYTLGRYQEALLSLTEATRLMPLMPLMPNGEMPHYLEGVCLDMLGDSQKALESFDAAIRLNPNNHIGYQGKGIALDKLGKYQEALQTLEYALQLNPNSPNTQNSIRIVKKHLGFDSF